MLHTGLRVSEVANLKVGDVRISPRKGSVTVRGGKGNKFRSVPLNADVRKAIQVYREERPEVDGDHLFMGQRGVPLDRVARLRGHESVDTTRIHTTPSE